MSDISKTQQGRPAQSGVRNRSVDAGEVNGILPLFGAVLNRLQASGVTCITENDEATGALVIRVVGAKVEVNDAGRKAFVMRAGQEGGDGQAQA